MKCPVCDVALSISSREGVEIDFCPQCRGVWLDRGELDKVIERASAAMAPVAPVADRGRPDERRDDRRYEERRDERRYDERRTEPRYEERRDDRRYDERRPDDDYKRKKKKRSFLDDLFEFD